MCRHRLGALAYVVEFRAQSSPVKRVLFYPEFTDEEFEAQVNCRSTTGGQKSPNSSPKWSVPKVQCHKGVLCYVWGHMYVHVCLCVNTQSWIYPPCLQRADLYGGRDSLFCYKSAKLTIRSNLIHSLVVKDLKFQN